jgi:hypothetical protein
MDSIGAIPTGVPPLEAQRLTLPKTLIYLVKIPPDQGYRIVAEGDSDGTRLVPDFIGNGQPSSSQPLAMINGGYFVPKTRRTTAYLIENGTMLLDPSQNRDLMGDTNVAPFLSRILNRSEFRRYQCLAPGGRVSDRYDITPHNAPSPPDCQRMDAVGAGPQLLPLLTDEAEAFYVTHNGKVLRDPLGRNFPNARSAIALLADSTILIAMAGQKPGAFDSGLSLTDWAEFLRGQGAIKAMNLDGGPSSALWYGGHAYYGRLDGQGQSVHQPVKSVLKVVRPGEAPQK